MFASIIKKIWSANKAKKNLLVDLRGCFFFRYRVGGEDKKQKKL